MTYHDKNITTAAKGLLSAAMHLQTKDEGDPFGLLTKKFGDLTDETLKRIGATDAKLAAVSETLSDMDQKMARGMNGGGPATPKTWGRQFIQGKEAELATLSQGEGGPQARVSMNVKAITSDGGSAGSLDAPTRDAPTAMPLRGLFIRDLLNVISISTGAVEYAAQTSRGDGADTVAEGAAKPESDMDWELRTTSSKVIAHWVKSSRQILEDAPQLRDMIDSEMRYGLALKEETQLLGGDGVGPNLLGMIPSATAYDDTVLTVASQGMIDTVGKAILQSALADFPATAVVVHPADWWRMRLSKNGDGDYILGDPKIVVQPSLFGLPVVATKAMSVDKFLVGDFPSAGTLYDRWAPRVEVGYVNDDFTRNLVTILAEERVAFAVKQNGALTYGDFGNVA